MGPVQAAPVRAPRVTPAAVAEVVMAAATEITVAIVRLARVRGANTQSATNLWGTPRIVVFKRRGTTPVATAPLMEATTAAAMAAEVEASAPRNLMMPRGALLLLRLIQ